MRRHEFARGFFFSLCLTSIQPPGTGVNQLRGESEARNVIIIITRRKNDVRRRQRH